MKRRILSYKQRLVRLVTSKKLVKRLIIRLKSLIISLIKSTKNPRKARVKTTSNTVIAIGLLTRLRLAST